MDMEGKNTSPQLKPQQENFDFKIYDYSQISPLVGRYDEYSPEELNFLESEVKKLPRGAKLRELDIPPKLRKFLELRRLSKKEVEKIEDDKRMVGGKPNQR
jgi:hypothetical protein